MITFWQPFQKPITPLNRMESHSFNYYNGIHQQKNREQKRNFVIIMT
jgi:hypothetical protein